MPVTQTSPSPCAACASPQLKSAPGTCTGRYSVVPLTSWRVSMFPPNVPGGITSCAAAPTGQTPIVPKNGSTGIAMSSRRYANLPSERSKMRRYGSGKSSGRRPAPGMIAVKPQPRVCRSRISTASVSPRLRALHRDRPRQRVHAIPVERRDRVGRRVGRDLVVGHIARLVRDRVAARDRQHGLVAGVPLEVDTVGWKRVLRHRQRTSLPLARTTSQRPPNSLTP